MEVVDSTRWAELEAGVEDDEECLEVIFAGNADQARRFPITGKRILVTRGDPDRTLNTECEIARCGLKKFHACIEAQVHDRRWLDRDRIAGRLGHAGFVARLKIDDGQADLEGDAIEDLGADVEVVDDLSSNGWPAVTIQDRGRIRIVAMVFDTKRIEGEAQSELSEEAGFRVPIGSPKTNGVLGSTADLEAVEVHRRGLGFGGFWSEKKSRRDGGGRESEKASAFRRVGARVLVLA